MRDEAYVLKIYRGQVDLYTMINILADESSIVSQYLRELRDVELQKDRQRFEHNVERLGMIAGYELSKRLAYVDHTTKTPLGTANTPVLKDQIVLGTILRAGLPLQHGIHKIIDGAELAFIGAGRKAETALGVEIDLTYLAAPNLTDKVLVIADTMLATGKSFVDAYNALTSKNGLPKKVFVVAVIASQAGVDYVNKHIPEAELIVCAVDQELNDKFFIVPGLGDAGDLLYGSKI